MKISRKITSLSLALALAVGLAVPAMAAETQTLTVEDLGLTMTNVVEVQRDDSKVAETGTDIVAITVQAPCDVTFEGEGLKKLHYMSIYDAAYNDVSFTSEYDPATMEYSQPTMTKNSATVTKPGEYTFHVGIIKDGENPYLRAYIQLKVVDGNGQVPSDQSASFPAPTGGETVTFGGYTLTNATGTRVLEREDAGMMMKWREYQVICPEYAALTGPNGEIIRTETGENYAAFSGNTPVQLPKGYYGPFQLDGYNGDLALFGETVAEGTYDYIDISIASGMPAQEKFAAAPDKLNGGVTQPAPSEQTTTAQPAPTPAPAEKPNVTTTTEGGIVYTVQKYDTLGHIALNYYGSYGYHKALYTANAAAFKATGGALKPGMTITLPDTLGSTKRLSTPVAGADETLYTVKAGDTLGAIAKSYYGDAMKYKDIFERNNDRLKNANTIYEGQVIVLPAK